MPWPIRPGRRSAGLRYLHFRFIPSRCTLSDGSSGKTTPRNGSHKEMDMTALTERAVLAGGCFWGMQDLIRRMPGVISTRVGYTGGEVPNATYRNHGNHAEAIEIVFDP